MIVYVGEKKDTFDFCSKVKVCRQIKSDNLRQIQELKSADLFLIDKELDHGDGFIVIDLVKNNKSFKGIPIILLSENMTEEDFDEHRFSDQAVDNYFKYPLDEKDFTENVKQFCNKKETNPTPQKQPETKPESIAATKVIDPPKVAMPVLKKPIESSQVTVPKTNQPPLNERTVALTQSISLGDQIADAETVAFNAKPLDSLFKDPSLDELYKSLEISKRKVDDRSLQEKLLTSRDLSDTELEKKLENLSLSEREELQTMRHYVKLQDQEVESLKIKLKRALEQKDSYLKEADINREETKRLESIVEDLSMQARGHEEQLVRLNSESLREIDHLREENNKLKDEIMKYQIQLRQEHEKIESLKEKLHLDVRKIRSRERELENKLEIVGRDAETLLANRDIECLDLKKKIDALEFALDQQKDKEGQIISNFEIEKGKLIEVTQKIKDVIRVLEE